jgi:iron complex outermembrane receptor protein
VHLRTVPLAALAAALAASAASAQEAPDAAPDAENPDIVVTAERGSALRGVAPVAVLDANAIAATGATSTGELLRTIRAQTQSGDGQEPIFLLNAQRVSGYQEIGTLPPEAIDKVEVLPEAAALKFGYPPTRRLVNFITKRNFRQVQLRATAGTTTDGGSARGQGNVALTRLAGDSRLTLSLEARHTDRLFQSERGIAPDPDILFDAIGNITAPGGGEIDPALSAAAGQIVIVAPVPEGAPSLAGFAAGANAPRLFDPGPYRTLVARNDALKAEAVVAGRIGAGIAASLSLSAEQSRDRSLGGLAVGTLTVPAGNPASPFVGDVLLHRAFVEADPLRYNQTVTTLHAGALLRGAVAGWRWDFTASIDRLQTGTLAEHGIDPAAAQAAIRAGTNPFVPLDPSLLSARLVDRSRLRTDTIGAKTVFSSPPVHLPAGEAGLTATVEAEQSSADSRTRGANPFELRLARGRVEAAVALDVPLASRRHDFLPFVGELSVNASVKGRRVGGFGSLTDTTFGLGWGPFEGVQLQAQLRRSAAAPGLTQLSSPVIEVENVPVFDFRTGRTEIVTLVQGGNPDLLAEHRRSRSLALNVKPFAKRELRLTATYEATTIRDQTGTVYALTPSVEAILPELVTRDASGRLTGVRVQPINFFRQRQRQLNLVISANGMIGKAPPPPAPGAKGPPPPRISYYGGAGPTLKFEDRLQLRPGTPELDLLHGETVTGGGGARVQGYFYGGVNYLGNGFSVDGWYGGANRVRNENPESDLRFSPIFKVNFAAFISLHHFLREQEWTSHTQVRLEVSNLTNARTQVRDANGNTPNRLQEAYLDPVGRTVSLTVRKLF